MTTLACVYYYYYCSSYSIYLTPCFIHTCRVDYMISGLELELTKLTLVFSFIFGKHEHSFKKLLSN